MDGTKENSTLFSKETESSSFLSPHHGKKSNYTPVYRMQTSSHLSKGEKLHLSLLAIQRKPFFRQSKIIAALIALTSKEELFSFLLGSWRKSFFIRYKMASTPENLPSGDEFHNTFIGFWLRRFFTRHVTLLVLIGLLGSIVFAGILFFEITRDRQKITILSPWLDIVFSLSELTIDPLERPDMSAPKADDKPVIISSTWRQTTQPVVGQTPQQNKNPDSRSLNTASKPTEREAISQTVREEERAKVNPSSERTTTSRLEHDSNTKDKKKENKPDTKEQNPTPVPRLSSSQNATPFPQSQSTHQKSETIFQPNNNDSIGPQTSQPVGTPQPQHDEKRINSVSKQEEHETISDAAKDKTNTKETEQQKKVGLSRLNQRLNNAMGTEGGKHSENTPPPPTPEAKLTPPQEAMDKLKSHSILHSTEISDEISDAFSDTTLSETDEAEPPQQESQREYRYTNAVSETEESEIASQDNPEEENKQEGIIEKQHITNQSKKTQANATPFPESVPLDKGTKKVKTDPISSFPLNVATTSYDTMRVSLTKNRLPPRDTIQVEEFINYFPYNYPSPTSEKEAIKTTVTVFPSPWSVNRKIMHIGIKAHEVSSEKRPRANIVFFVDTSSSMTSADRLPLVRKVLSMLVDTMAPEDTIAIASYGGSFGVLLEPTYVREKDKILGKINQIKTKFLRAKLKEVEIAYTLAEQNADKNKINRIFMITSDDFAIETARLKRIKDFISHKSKQGVSLSVLGFGAQNYGNDTLKILARSGNGTVADINTLSEARKIFMQNNPSAIIPTIAREARIQVEFNPEAIQSYRLIGYEKPPLHGGRYRTDKGDIGNITSGQVITAMYEILPKEPARGPYSHEYAVVRMHYKHPKSGNSIQEETIVDSCKDYLSLVEVSKDVRFSFAVASFAEILRESQLSGSMTLNDIIKIAQEAKGNDQLGFRAEFIRLVQAAKTARRSDP